MSGLGRPAERFSVVAFPHSDGAVVSCFLCRTKVVQYLGGHYVVELLFFLVYTPRLGRRRGRADISTSTAYVGKLKMHSGKLRSQNSKT
ncbi:uncharacterized protein LOC116435244 isoform X3 [Nomia melanderi]|uniref:uncharacterized protein LOC116435244 isoform X3 n=1 Tax=Nomia melanderi TaxID=2448451 RepID=UPI003FCEC305